MSFILDALKKSENERKRTIGPSLADAPIRRIQSERPWWAAAVGALLIVNLGVLLVVLIRRDATPAASVAPSIPSVQFSARGAAAGESPAAPAEAPSNRFVTTRSNPAVRSLADEAITSDASGSYYDDRYEADYAPPNAALAAAAAVPEGPPIVQPLRDKAAAPAQPAAAEQSNEILPTLNSLNASGSSLPELRLDIHVYSATPKERFVYVNMHKYLEGQTLSEGPHIERITPEGVILNSQGLRFLLPHQ